MIHAEGLKGLLSRWAADASGCRVEGRHLEHIDRERHAISIAMLEARALALEKCIAEMATLKAAQ